MDLEAALLDATRDDPDDDAPRLALADYLMEQSDPVQRARGEFIAVQCRLARLDEHDAEWPALKAREQQLLDEFKPVWCGDLIESNVRESLITFQRGLVALGRITTHGLGLELDHLAELPSWRWVYALHLCQDSAACLNASGLRESLRGITAISLSSSFIRDAVLEAITQGVFPRLTYLDISYTSLSDAHVEMLTASPTLSRLRSLLLDNNPLTAQAAEALANCRYLTRLRHLSLAENYFGPDGIVTLTRSPYLSNLGSLFLHRYGVMHLVSGHTGVQGGGFTTPSRSIGNVGARALARWLALSRLRELSLSKNHISAEGLRALTGSPVLARLNCLDLSVNPLSTRGARLLASSPYLDQLTRLDVQSCDLRRGVADLARSGTLAHLRCWALKNNRVDAAGARALAESPYLRELRNLSLADNPIGDVGVAHLTRSSTLTGLVELGLHACQITDRGAIDLAGAGRWPNLRKLYLTGCYLGDPGRSALRARFGPRVTLS